MAKFAKPANQAAKAVARGSAIGSPRHGNRQDGKHHSVRSANTCRAALTSVAQWLRDAGYDHGLPKLTKDEAMEYLVDRSVMVGQADLDVHRVCLQKYLGTTLERVESERPTVLATRSYTSAQAGLISSAQAARNALATEVARYSGNRAHELLTIRPLAEQPPSGHRKWLPDLFVGREGWVRYSVIGKGGLIREVRLPKELADLLEALRLAQPRVVMDRGVRYEQFYDLGGGNAWSSSFTRASQRALGWSNGAHGLRHSYAQERMEDYQSAGYSWWDAMARVAQELGHFAPSTTLAYLR
jgi:integrase